MSKTLKTIEGVPEARLGTYIFGFILSVGLTLLAYVAVTTRSAVSWELFVLVASLAFIQLIVQLVCFLHLGKESKPRWNLLVFLFMLLIVGIVVGGSLWIMYSLNYQHASSTNSETDIIHGEGIHH